MAEMVSSAVVQETVSQILSGLVHKVEKKDKLSANESVERLEMALIKLNAALEISNKWLITDASLLRWRKKLKLAAQECNGALHECKQRIQEEEHVEREIRNSTFPKRIAHAAKSFIFSGFSSKSESSTYMIRRFEWFADGTSEFLRFIELGGTPRCDIPASSLIRHLFAGNELHHKVIRGKGYPSFLLLQVVPFHSAEHGIEASMVFIHKDGNAPENDFFLSVILQVSESTDIIGTAIKCLQLYTHHFEPTVEIIRKELTQLPTQDFSWVPYVDSRQKKHWENLHNFSTQWFRPNPLCCKQHNQHGLCHSSKVDLLDTSRLQDVYLESVIEVNLQCQVSLQKYKKQRNLLFESKTSSPHYDSSHLKVGLLFMPHGSSDGLLPAGRSAAMAIHNGEQHCLRQGATLEELEETILPVATDYFSQNSEVTAYQVLWKSKHGTAYIQVEKASRTRRAFYGARKRKLLQHKYEELESPTDVISRFIDLWATLAPVHLQSSIMDWSQKEKRIQLG
ncbi:hypothetical protein U9M48_011520 [Paspalum notatum var. saurae]|uniref:Rx N-terminal domain-containing protein n=1 Tax=Paspalum notatum var. saurae TaxID=547442 RepID=A0AAQ3WH84_PASNO